MTELEVPYSTCIFCKQLRAQLAEAQKEVTDWKAKYIDARKSGYQEGLEEMQTKLALAESDVSIKHKYRADVLERERDALHAKLECAVGALKVLTDDDFSDSLGYWQVAQLALADIQVAEPKSHDTTHASKYCVCKACSIAARAGEEREP